MTTDNSKVPEDFGSEPVELTPGDERQIDKWLARTRRGNGAQAAPDAPANQRSDDGDEIGVEEVDPHAARRPSKQHHHWSSGHARGGNHRGSGKKGPEVA